MNSFQVHGFKSNFSLRPMRVTSCKTHKWPQTKWYTKKTPFCGTGFHTLSHGELRFVASVSFRNHWMAPWLAVKEFQPVRRWFFELTFAAKRITPCEREWKAVLENGVFSCVQFCLRSPGCFERCGVGRHQNSYHGETTQGRLKIWTDNSPFSNFLLAPVCKRVQCGKNIGAIWVH